MAVCSCTIISIKSLWETCNNGFNVVHVRLQIVVSMKRANTLLSEEINHKVFPYFKIKYYLCTQMELIFNIFHVVI